MDADALAAAVEPPLRITFRKGQPVFRRNPGKRLYKVSKLIDEFSTAEWHEWSRQLADAVVYLKESGDRIRTITSGPGVDSAGIDFPIDHCEGDDPALELRPDESVVTHISAEFIAAIAEFDLFAEFSHYSYRTSDLPSQVKQAARLWVSLPDEAIHDLSLPPYDHTEDGISFPIGGTGELPIKDQIREATAFLETWSESIREISQRSPEKLALELVTRFDGSTVLPPAFLHAAAKTGIAVQLIYLPAPDEPDNQTD